MFGKDNAALDAVLARLDEIDAGTKASIESLRNHLDERLDQVRIGLDQIRSEATEIAAATSKDLLEVVTAITTSFMTETIEIKAGVEAIVDVLSSAVSPEPSAASSALGACAVKGCTKPAEVTTSWKMDILTPAEDVNVCESHAKMMAQQAFQAPKKAAAGSHPADHKCEHGVDMGPDYVVGQIHAHLDENNQVFDPSAKVPDRESFAREHDIGEGAPDESVLKPAPLDDISAMIEAAYKAKKSDIDAALDSK